MSVVREVNELHAEAGMVLVWLWQRLVINRPIEQFETKQLAGAT